MAYVVKVPNVGASADEGEVVAWHVEEGERVEEGTLLVEVEAEKEILAVEAREAGVLRHLLRPAGATVAPGDALGVVAAPDVDVADLLAGVDVDPDAGDGDDDTTGADIDGDSSVESSEDGTVDSTANAGETTDDGPESVRASPRARRLAHEHGVDVEALAAETGTAVVSAEDVEAAVADESEGGDGAGGDEPSAGDDESTTGDDRQDRVDPDDVRASPRARRLADQHGVDLAALAAELDADGVSAADVEAAAGTVGSRSATGDGDAGDDAPVVGDATRTVVEERPLTGLRETIGERLSRSYRDAVHVTVEREVVVDEFLDRVDELDAAVDVDVSFEDLLFVAVSRALDEHPEFNATFEDGVHRLHAEQNVCTAVDTDRGLLAPVVPAVEDRDVESVATARRAAADRVRAGEHSADDLAGGTFTVTNLGPLGVSSFDPVINPPQVAILAVNAIEEAVVPVEDGLRVVERVTFGLSFDHRVVDGADAARFLGTLAAHVESPGDLG